MRHAKRSPSSSSSSTSSLPPPPPPLGAVRQFALHVARGTIVVHFDDDDVYAPRRLRTQVLDLARRKRHISMLNFVHLVDARRARLLRRLTLKPTYHPGSLAYVHPRLLRTAELGDAARPHYAPHMPVAEDLDFFYRYAATPNTSAALIADRSLWAYVRTGQNTVRCVDDW